MATPKDMPSKKKFTQKPTPSNVYAYQAVSGGENKPTFKKAQTKMVKKGR